MSVGLRKEIRQTVIRRGERASVAMARTRLHKGRKGAERKTRWAPRIAYL